MNAPRKFEATKLFAALTDSTPLPTDLFSLIFDYVYPEQSWASVVVRVRPLTAALASGTSGHSNLKPSPTFFPSSVAVFSSSVEKTEEKVTSTTHVSSTIRLDPADDQVLWFHGPNTTSSSSPADVSSSSPPRRFTFDRVFGPSADQADVFESVRRTVHYALEGSNACVIAYGDAGSGKAYTMQGPLYACPSSIIC